MFYDADGKPVQVNNLGDAYRIHRDDAKKWRDRAIEAETDIAGLIDACERLLQFNEELCKDVGVSKHYPSADNARTVLSRVKQRTSGLPASRE